MTSNPSNSMKEMLFLNGCFLPLEEGRIGVEDRGFQFADGIYEVIRYYQGRAFALDLHHQRLERSAEGLLLELPYSANELREIGQELVNRSSSEDAILYMQLTRGIAPRLHTFPENPHLTFLAYARTLPPLPPTIYEEGVSVITLPDDRWARCDLKTICLLPNILAKEKAHQANANEAILYDAATGTIHEGTSSNIFCVRDGVAITPPLTNKILPGVTRHLTIEVAAEQGVTCLEQPVAAAQLLSSDEVFLTSTTREILPVVEIDGKQIGSGRPGAITRRLHAGLRKRVEASCASSSACPTAGISTP